MKMTILIHTMILAANQCRGNAKGILHKVKMLHW